MSKQPTNLFRAQSGGAINLDHDRGILAVELNAVHNNSKWQSLINVIINAKTVSVLLLYGFHHAKSTRPTIKPRIGLPDSRRDKSPSVMVQDPKSDDLPVFNDQRIGELCCAVAELLRNSASLRCLHLHGLRFTHSSMRDLSIGIREAIGLDELSLAGCVVGDAGVRLLTSALCSSSKDKNVSSQCSLRVLDLTDAQLTSRCAAFLADLIVHQSGVQRTLNSLGKVCCIRRLTLNHNPKFGDAGVKLLCESAMKCGKKLQLRAIDLINVGATDRVGSLAIACLGTENQSQSLEILDLRKNPAISKETIRTILKQALRNAVNSSSARRKSKEDVVLVPPKGDYAWIDLRSKRSCECETYEDSCVKGTEVRSSQSPARASGNAVHFEQQDDGLDEVVRLVRDQPKIAHRRVSKSVLTEPGPPPVNPPTASAAEQEPERNSRPDSSTADPGRMHRSQSASEISHDPPAARIAASPMHRSSVHVAESPPDDKVDRSPSRPGRSSPSHGSDGRKLRHNLAELDDRIAALRDENLALKNELADLRTVASRVRFVRDSRLLDTLSDAFSHMEALLSALERSKGRPSSIADTTGTHRMLREARKLCGIVTPQSATPSSPSTVPSFSPVHVHH